MTIDKREVRRRFDRQATAYDRHAQVQQDMADRLIARLAARRAWPGTILELGSGTGYLTEGLAHRFPAARITAVDLADTMVAVTRERLRGHDVELAVADAESAEWGGRRFELIVSSATIQWFAAPATTLRRLAAALEPGGLMLHATFGPRTFRELFATLERVERERGLPPRPHGLGLMTAVQWSALLRSLGLTAVQADERLDVREYPSCRALLASIRGTGASFAPGAGPGPDVLADAMRRYDSDHAGAAGVTATYDVIELAARARAASSGPG